MVHSCSVTENPMDTVRGFDFYVLHGWFRIIPHDSFLMSLFVVLFGIYYGKISDVNFSSRKI